MTPPNPIAHIDTDCNLAFELAAGAAGVLAGLRATVGAGPADCADGLTEPAAGALRRAGDAAAQAHLASVLARRRPDDAILSEEAPDDPARLGAARVWIIDPLDGTREFAERHPDGSWRDDFAVHVALWERGRGLTAAAIALPGRGRVLRSDTIAPASADGVRAVLAGERPIRLAVSRSRPPALVACLAERPDVTFVRMGSNGVKTVAVIEGTVDAYVHAGGQYEWDSAAPVALASAAGLVATRLDGSPLAWNQPNPWSPDLVVCHPAVRAHVRTLIDAGSRLEQGVPS